MTPSEADLSLIAQCDEAAEQGFLKCDWCDAHGHSWRECQEYEAYVRKISVGERLRTGWGKILMLLVFGFAAGMAFKALLEAM